MKRKNCWEIKMCGREPGGENAKELSVCPAALPHKYDGVNKGKHVGRFCWTITGTFCEGETQGTYAKKITDCLSCEVLKQVNEDEGRYFILTPPKEKGES